MKSLGMCYKFLISIYFLIIIMQFNIVYGQTTKVIAVVGGESHSAALKENGTVWAWGANGGGQVGNGDVGENVLSPVQVAELTGYLTGITAIAAGTAYWLNQGGHTLALKNDGTVWAWGGGLEGQIGDGAGISRSIPVQVVDEADPTGYLTNVKLVGAGDFHSIAVKNDGTVCSWGSNAYGQLGDGTKEEKFTSIQIPGLANVTAVTGGAYHSLALKGDGTVWAWGANGSGQLGDGTSGWPASKTTPVQVLDPSDPTGYLTNIVAIAAGDEHSLALKSNGTVWSWGANPWGQLGDGTSGWPESKITPVQVIETADPTGYLTSVIAIAGGDDYSMALKADGTVWTFGANNWGQLGDGTTTDKNIPVQVSGLTNVTFIAAGNGHSLAVKSDGTIWAWGGNWAGQLGDGTTDQSTTPVQTIFLEQEGAENLLEIRGPYFITPGEKVTYMVHYENIMDETLEDAVIVLDLSEDFAVISTTGNGRYRDDPHRVFWILGDVSSGEKGSLAVTMEVAWGLSLHSTRNLFFEIGARNISTSINIDEYLNSSAIELVSEKGFTEEEIIALLSSDQELKNLFDHAIQLGYNFDNVAQQFDYSDGSSFLQFTFIDPETFSPAFLIKSEDSIHIETYHEGTISLFTQDGGYNVDVNDGSSTLWGGWAGGSDQSSSESWSTWTTKQHITNNTTNASSSTNATHTQTRSYCTNVCIIKNIPEWWDYIKNNLKVSGDTKKARWCFNCQFGLAGGKWDPENCEKCARLFAQTLVRRIKQGVDIQKVSPPLYKYGGQVRKCVRACKDNPDTWQCSDHITWCSTAVRPLKLITSEIPIPDPVAMIRQCQKGKDGSSHYGVEKVLQWCTDGKCVVKDDIAQCVWCNTKNNSKNLYQVATPSNVGCKRSEVLAAHDPNAKHVDVLGDVIPGQTLNYTIEYENEGEGTAYDVFILDELCSELDESTLVINNGGDYSDVSRLLSWDVGEVPPGGQGEVTFSVNVKEGIASGTEAINYADVHFPSASEITPTNPVVNTVKSIAADPQTIETISETPVSITLTGRDTATSTVAYEITSAPSYGTLTGTPPHVSYTSMDEFSGQDDFYFVVNNGIIDSDPAKVTIIVEPNPADNNPPEVTETYPVKDATNVYVDDTPVSEDPKQYIPMIIATFSEPIESETVTTAFFTVAGLTGAVYYDEKTRTAYFIPSVPLALSTTYTARLSTGIKDKMGNPMASEYSWQFTTISEANIEVTLSDNADAVDFGEVIINTTSDEKIVSISSTGTIDLVLGSITLAGIDSGEFRITEDNCSGVTLEQFMNCTVTVVCEPVSTGTKSANLSISSNDTDENTVDVTLSGSGVTEIVTTTTTAKSSEPCPFKKIYGEHSKQAELLRNLRDNVLNKTPEGQEIIRLYYEWSPVIVTAMEEDMEFREEVKELIDGFLGLVGGE